MTKQKTTKKALLLSALALFVCIAMFIGSTFAWFTDSVTSAGNIIKSGTLDVDLVDENNNSLAGKVINFKTADSRAQENILWEPGCTYEMEPVYVVNKGNLALKYEIVINGIDGDAKLLEAIDWTVTVDGAKTDISTFEGTLIPGKTVKSGAIVLSGHMKESAGNEYQGLTAEGISITVFATQYTYEKDSFNDQYDKDAVYADTYVTSATELNAALANGGIVALMNDIEGIDANTAITVPSGKETVLNLNGHTLSASANKTGNQEIFLVKGNMTVKDGTLELTAENNQGWNAMATIFDVTAGGVLNLEGVTAKVIGTDMNFIVHLNNWGSATLNVNDCDFTSTYVAVRVFNSGNDMNNVTIKNTDFHGGRVFWVHNYESEGKDDSTLNLNIYGNGNTTDNAQPVRFGFSSSTYYDINGNKIQ